MQKAEVSVSLAACVAIAAGVSLSLADVQPVRKPPSDTASGLAVGSGAVARPTTMPIWSNEDRRMSLISRPRDKSGARMSGYVKVFDRTTGDLQASFTSPEAEDLFGFSVAAIGDVDGDGRSDIAVGAPLSNSGGRHSGAIYVFSSETGEELTKFVGEPGELLGRSLGAVGDFDGDGAPDLAAGYVDRGPEPADALRRLRQRIREVDGRSIGSDRNLLERRSEAREDRGSLEGSVDRGRRERNNRDISEPDRHTPTGAVRVFSMEARNTIGDFAAPHGQPRFGATIAPAGDTNGDGLDDIAVSALATRTESGVVQPATVYVFAGRAQGGGDQEGLPLSTIVAGSAGETRDAEGRNIRRIDGDRQITVTGDAIDEPQPTDGATGDTNDLGDPDCPPTLNSVVNEDGMTFLATSTEFADPTQSTSSLEDPCCDEGGPFLLSTEPGIEPSFTAISSEPLVGDIDRDGLVTSDDAIALVRYRELRGRVDIARFSRTVQMVTLQLGQHSEWMPASPEIRIFPGEPLPLEDGDAGSDMTFLTNTIEDPCCGGDGDIIDPFPCDDGGGGCDVPGDSDCDGDYDDDDDGIPDDQDDTPNGCENEAHITYYHGGEPGIFKSVRGSFTVHASGGEGDGDWSWSATNAMIEMDPNDDSRATVTPEQPGPVSVTATRGCSDTWDFTAVDLDLDLSGLVEITPNDPDDPASQVLLANLNDDDGDGTLDRDDGNIAGEDDFVQMKASGFEGVSANIFSDPSKWSLSTSSNVKVWYRLSDGDILADALNGPPDTIEDKVVGGVTYRRMPSLTYIDGTPPDIRTLYVEGQSASGFVSGTGIEMRFEGTYEQELESGQIVNRTLFVSGPLHATVVSFELLNPTDTDENNKVDDPATAANGFSGNEFVFNEEDTGVLTLPAEVKVLPDVEEVRALISDSVRFEIDAIGDSHAAGGDTDLSWENDFGNFVGKGVYDAGKGLWKATATVSGLPMNNSDFGDKAFTATLSNIGGASMEHAEDVQIFYPRDADNHPGPDHVSPNVGNVPDDFGAGDAGRAPNWFHYWNQVIGGGNVFYHDDLNGIRGVAPAMRWWTIPLGFSKNEVWIEPTAAGNGVRRAGGMQATVTGIDFFANVVAHEERHTEQISEHDALLGPLNGQVGTVWEAGWSFNVGGDSSSWNHWTLGPDGQPSVAGTDEDGDGVTDEKTDNTELGFIPSDDINLDVNINDVADSLPYDGIGIELDAQIVETVHEHTHWLSDWGAPGKQHATDKKYDD